MKHQLTASRDYVFHGFGSNQKYAMENVARELYLTGIPVTLLPEIPPITDPSMLVKYNRQPIHWIGRLGPVVANAICQWHGRPSLKDIEPEQLSHTLRMVSYDCWKVLPVHEQLAYLRSECVQSELSEAHHYDPLVSWLDKLRLSMWHYGCHEDPVKQIAAANALRSFTFGEGFTAYFDFTTGYNDRGYSRFTQTFLDGELALLIFRKDVHVLTIGFSLSRFGLLIQQIQLKQKTGNRWLYKLPCNYVEYAVRQMHQAFRTFPLWLIDGSSSARANQQAHATGDKTILPTEVMDRIRKTYSRRLQGFRRQGWRKYRGITYHKLHQY